MSKATEDAARVVHRIAMSTEYTRKTLSLAPGTHECKAGKDGACVFCPPAVENARLMPQGRTGELTWEAK